MKLIIHRGTHEIGGTCIELIAENSRILIDAGLPLSEEQEKIPATLKHSLKQTAVPLKGILISHPHLDHYGLLEHITHNVPVFAGKAASVLMETTLALTDKTNKWIPPVTFRSGREFEIGDFTIKPYLVDHSGYDSYAFLIKSQNKSIFYSGDFRSHGRKGKLFERFLRKPPRIDVLLLEGTMIGTERETGTFTEQQLEARFVGSIKATEGAVFVTLSSQNIDRIVTLFRACKKSGRTLVIDPYTAEILKRLKDVQTASDIKCSLPQASWKGIYVCYPQHLCRWLEKNGNTEMVAKYRKYGKPWSYFSENASSIVMLARPSSAREIFDRKYFDLPKAKWIYSMWHGYLETGKKFAAMAKKFKEKGVCLEHIHTSGHADMATLKKLAENIKYKNLIPIHTSEPERYKNLFKNVTIASDGAVFTV